MDNLDYNNAFDLNQEAIEEYSSLLLRLRSRMHLLRPFQRRHSTFSSQDNLDDLDSDSLCDSFNSSSFDDISKNSNEEEIMGFDYKSYPITLDWLQIDNDKHYHAIFSSRGAMGIILLNCLPVNSKPNSIEDNFLAKIVNTYIMRLNSSKEHIDELMSKLPKHNELNSIIFNGYYVNKETILLKIIIDFQCCYLKSFDGPLYANLKDWFLTAKAFYAQLSEEEIQLIRNEIKLPSCYLKTKIRIIIPYYYY